MIADVSPARFKLKMTQNNLEKTFRIVGIAFFSAMIAVCVGLIVGLYSLQHLNVNLTFLKCVVVVLGILIYVGVNSLMTKLLK